MDHVYLTENTYRPTPHMRGQLNDFVSEGFLTYEVDGTTGPQLKLYRRCMEQHYHKHNWLAFLDLDEILVLREQYVLFTSIPSVFRWFVRHFFELTLAASACSSTSLTTPPVSHD